MSTTPDKAMDLQEDLQRFGEAARYLYGRKLKRVCAVGRG